MLRINVPPDAETGEYSIPIQVDANVVGARATTSTWINFTVKSLSFFGEIPDYMSWLFLLLLAAIVAYAYIKR
jgi:uncharacterized membrane protein